MTDTEKALIDLLQTIDREYGLLVIIVEGRRDEEALRDLGITAEIVRTQSYMSRSELVDALAYLSDRNLSVLILTDYDEEGMEIAKHFEQELQVRKVKTLRRLRGKIRALMEDRLCIEDLHSLFKRDDSPEPAGPSR